MILEYDKSMLASIFGVPLFRANQIRRWIFSRKVSDFNLMTDLSREFRLSLIERFGSVFHGKELLHEISDDFTEKLLIEWLDGERVECVLLRDDRGHRTACISTQVGCAMRCVFCASGMNGFVRNLTRGEILEQILRLNILLPSEERLTHIVVMGIGEPLLNLHSLLYALDEVTSVDGLDLSIRRVTISTVGIPAGIIRLADYVKEGGKGYKLAISLHAPNNKIRSSIIPENKIHNIQEILNAADYYFKQTGRRITFEYTLIEGVNDRPEHAIELVNLLSGKTAIVNIIPLNPIKDSELKTPSKQVIEQFVNQLKSGGLQVKIRMRKGDKINAACGQLRRNATKNVTIQ
ncbi:MAG: 23S rRNA (adenine(2503)-C(2))-methyltransferase RlmN [Planctomycetaceae bacterium]|jgi:23S rRNA (adenine2503-C2)-methyltransferase|nr:23S rRNA (adenine(2503)-C(2))-methyltransferase RlmN [Planctomycetaceae bacterium]